MITNFDSIIFDYFQTKKLCGASITKFLYVYKEVDSFLDDFLIKHTEFIKNYMLLFALCKISIYNQ